MEATRFTSGPPAAARPTRLGRSLNPVWFLGAAMAASALLIWFETAGQTFVTDEMARLYARPGVTVDSLFTPEQGNLIAGMVLLTKAYTAVFGIDRTVLRLLMIALDLLMSALVFEWLRRRVADWYAVLPATLLLFFGAGGEQIAVTIGIAALIPITAGLGAMLLLERQDLRGDLLACGLLLAGLATYSTTIGFIAAAALMISLRPPPARWRRAWVWLAPLAMYLAWRVWVEINDPPLLSYPIPDSLTLSKLFLVPAYVLDSLAGACAGLTGLFHVSDNTFGFTPDFGVPLALAFIALVGYRISAGGETAKRILVVAIPLLVVWTTIALSYVPLLREPTVQRYVAFGALFVVLILGELCRGLELTPRRFGVAAAIWLVALIPNITQLHRDSEFVGRFSRITKAKLAVLELARGRVDPAFRPEADERVLRGDTMGSMTPAVSAGGYFAGSDAWGSLAYSPSELERAPEEPQRLADVLLAQALRLQLAPTAAQHRPGPGPASLGAAGGTVAPAGPCLSLRPAQHGAAFLLRLPPAGVSLLPAAGDVPGVAIGRFSEGTPYSLGAALAGTASTLALGADASKVPWRATVTAAAPVRVCGLPAGGG